MDVANGRANGRANLRASNKIARRANGPRLSFRPSFRSHKSRKWPESRVSFICFALSMGHVRRPRGTWLEVLGWRLLVERRATVAVVYGAENRAIIAAAFAWLCPFGFNLLCRAQQRSVCMCV